MKDAFSFFAKNRTPVMIGVLILVVAVLIWIITKDKDPKSEDEEAIKKLDAQGMDGATLVKDAHVIYTALAPDAAWYDVRNWTENEEAAIRIVKKYNRQSFPLLEDAYWERFSRQLMADLEDYFSESQIGEIAHVL